MLEITQPSPPLVEIIRFDGYMEFKDPILKLKENTFHGICKRIFEKSIMIYESMWLKRSITGSTGELTSGVSGHVIYLKPKT